MTARTTVVQRIGDNDSPAADRGRRARRAIPAALALAAYALAFLQRPGELVADTKIDLHTDPVGFLADAAAAWAPSGGLGQVQAGQYAGYLWPMGPFHALGDLIGLAPWVTQRLWLGTLLALAAWGTVRLLDALAERPRGVPHLVAGALMVANPYVVVFANRTSVTLLAYALLPWLLLAVHRGVRHPRGWLWPAVTALLVTSLGGGVNAAVASWVLLGPALLVAYETAFVGVAWRDAGRFLVRAVPLTALASAWWIAPVLVQIGYGVDFLPFTEPAGAIWTSTSMSESLRLMGFWVAYLGVGYGPDLTPAFDTGPTLLYAPLVIVAGFAVPALAIAGFTWTRRARYGPFFAGLALIALLVMFTGFPDGAPLRRALHNAYDEVEIVRFLRTAYKAGPLLALALACLGGMAAGVLWERLRGRAPTPALALLAGGALIVGWAAPLFEGRAVDRQISFDRVPADWERAAAGVDRELPRGTRALVLPGQVFPFYRWGGTQDAILPALTDRPVSVRGVVPYADLRAVELLWATDSLVQQRRTLPGQLAPLLALMGAGEVVVGTDDDRFRSGAVAPAPAADELRRGAGLAVADSRLGAVRRYALPASQGLVRVKPLTGVRIVDGSAAALTGLAALDDLPERTATLYAADLSPAEIRAAARAGAEVVVSDSNRRRVVLPSQPRQAEGATLGPGDPIPPDGPVLDPFARGGSAAQTVAVYEGARSVIAPFSPSFVQFPEHRPYAALDGDRATWWNADRYLEDDERWIEIDFGRRIDVPVLGLLPQRETRTILSEVEIAGERYRVRPGWNRLPVGLRDVTGLRVNVTAHEGPPPGLTGGAGAIAELRIPGVRVRERLRPPQLATEALAGIDRRATPLAFLFERTTGTDPFDREANPDPDATSVPESDSQSGALVATAGDGELAIARRFELPAARAWRADGWATVAPGTPASLLERWRGSGGRIAAPCGGVTARAAVAGRAATLRMRPVGSMAGLRRGLPVRALACGPPVVLPAGEATLVGRRRPLRADLLRLRSPAPRGPVAQRPVGRVIDRGGDGRGSRDGVEVALREPAWLILAESYNRGWRAECDGRDLGHPRPIDGFANGWRAPADCRDVSFGFRPQRLMTAGFAVSGVTVALLALLVAGLLRRRGRATARTAEAEGARGPTCERRTRALPLGHALAIGVAVGAVGAFLFALRAGLVIGPAAALILWRGVAAAPLALTAGVLAGVALPAVYLLFPPADNGGFNSDYANDLIGAHWVAVAVWVLFALAVSRAIPRRRAAGPPDAGEG